MCKVFLFIHKTFSVVYLDLAEQTGIDVLKIAAFCDTSLRSFKVGEYLLEQQPEEQPSIGTEGINFFQALEIFVEFVESVHDETDSEAPPGLTPQTMRSIPRTGFPKAISFK